MESLLHDIAHYVALTIEIVAILIIAFGFLFVLVSSRLTGEVGSSSCPTSGMMIWR